MAASFLFSLVTGQAGESLIRSGDSLKGDIDRDDLYLLICLDYHSGVTTANESTPYCPEEIEVVGENDLTLDLLLHELRP